MDHKPDMARKAADLIRCAMRDLEAAGFAEDDVLAGTLAAFAGAAAGAHGPAFAAHACDRAAAELRGCGHA